MSNFYVDLLRPTCGDQYLLIGLNSGSVGTIGNLHRLAGRCEMLMYKLTGVFGDGCDVIGPSVRHLRAVLSGVPD